MEKTYLGDGLYANHDGYQVWLTTQQGAEVALEPQVIDAFLRYLEKTFSIKITTEKVVAETDASALQPSFL